MTKITIENLTVLAEVYEELVTKARRLHKKTHINENNEESYYIVESVHSIENGQVTFVCRDPWNDVNYCEFSFQELANEAAIG